VFTFSAIEWVTQLNFITVHCTDAVWYTRHSLNLLVTCHILPSVKSHNMLPESVFCSQLAQTSDCCRYVLSVSKTGTQWKLFETARNFFTLCNTTACKPWCCNISCATPLNPHRHVTSCSYSCSSLVITLSRFAIWKIKSDATLTQISTSQLCWRPRPQVWRLKTKTKT